MKKNHYETLGVENFADLATVKKAFKRHAKELHPDKFEFGSDEAAEKAEQLRKYTDAYNPIKTPDLKDKYDRELRLFLRRHKPADQVEEPEGQGQGAKAWGNAKPDAQPEPDTTTAEPKAEQPKAPPEPDTSDLSPRDQMMKKKLDKAYGWEDEDPKPTIDVTL